MEVLVEGDHEEDEEVEQEPEESQRQRNGALEVAQCSGDAQGRREGRGKVARECLIH